MGLLRNLYALSCAPRRIHVLAGDCLVAANADIVGLTLGQTADGLRDCRCLLDRDCLVTALEVLVCAVLNLEPGDTAQLLPACRHGLCLAVFDAGQSGCRHIGQTLACGVVAAGVGFAVLADAADSEGVGSAVFRFLPCVGRVC